MGVTQPRRVVSKQHPWWCCACMCSCNGGRLGTASCAQVAHHSQAALTVARRVAQEMGCAVGADVGYRVRFEERMSPSTRIVYLTGTGVLLARVLQL